MDQGEEVAISKARRGDCDAFRVLVERHARAVHRLAFRMTGNEIDAEDMVQETFFRAWKQLAKFDGRASFGTWLHRICANCSLDYLRARQRKQEVRSTDRREEVDPLESVATESPSPERLAQSSQVAAMLAPALDALTEMERAAFVMRHYEGMGIEEIASVLGVQSGAAKHSVFRAVQKLRRSLEAAVSFAR